MIWIWIGFICLIFALLALDLGVFNRKVHVINVKEALWWSAFWISLGLLFTVFVYFGYEHHWLGLGMEVDAVDKVLNNGHSAAAKYLTGYVVEKSLSMDNIFVFAMLFGYFAVPPIYQHRVLYWGIMGALLMRGAMIALGATLVAEFHWVLYLFGVFLIFTAVKMLVMETEHVDPNRNYIIRLTRKLFPVTNHFHGEHFVVRAGSAESAEAAVKGEAQELDGAVAQAHKGAMMLTPLALALISIEVTDVIFAVDSIPAIFAITADPFLVFTSNVFAILGLRSLYFALASMMRTFRYLKTSLAVVLAVVGVKMLAVEWLKEWLGRNASLYLLAVVVLVLTVGVVASIVAQKREGRALAETPR